MQRGLQLFLNIFGMKQATFYKTIARRNVIFRKKFEAFLHPNLYVQCGKQPLPRLLEVYPCAKEQMVAFRVKKMSHLSIEAVYQFIHSAVIPKFATLWKVNRQNVLLVLQQRQHPRVQTLVLLLLVPGILIAIFLPTTIKMVMASWIVPMCTLALNH